MHRAIRACLDGETYAPGDWESIGAHCSMTERRADDATRDAEAFLRHGLEVAAVDASPQRGEEALKPLPGADMKVATAEELPFEDHSYDLVFLGLVFHETDDPAKAVSEALRVARRRIAILVKEDAPARALAGTELLESAATESGEPLRAWELRIADFQSWLVNGETITHHMKVENWAISEFERRRSGKIKKAIERFSAHSS